MTYLFGGSGDDTVSFVNRTIGVQFNVPALNITLARERHRQQLQRRHRSDRESRLRDCQPPRGIGWERPAEAVPAAGLPLMVAARQRHGRLWGSHRRRGGDLQPRARDHRGAFGDTYVSIENATGGSGSDVPKGSRRETIGSRRRAATASCSAGDGGDTPGHGTGIDISTGRGRRRHADRHDRDRRPDGGRRRRSFRWRPSGHRLLRRTCGGIALSLTSGIAMGGDADGDTLTNVNRVSGGALLTP